LLRIRKGGDMDELTQLINELLDQARQDLDLTSDEGLGQKLGTTGASISRWRHGEVSTSCRVLLPLLKRHPHGVEHQQ
jgi:hypothetical protein